MKRSNVNQHRWSALATTTAAVVVAAFALAPSAARADTTVATDNCPSRPLSQPFLPWADPSQYEFLPNGGFERGDVHWTFDGGASVTAQNEPYQVHGANDSSSLGLPTGASAQSAAMCVDLADPTLRLFAVNTGSPLSTLEVDAVYTDALGNPQTTPIALVTSDGTWQPTDPIPILANLASPPLLTNGTTQVALRFTVLGDSGNWMVDDVHVDPFKTK